jgi:hypothetical protein
VSRIEFQNPLRFRRGLSGTAHHHKTAWPGSLPAS